MENKNINEVSLKHQLNLILMKTVGMLNVIVVGQS